MPHVVESEGKRSHVCSESDYNANGHISLEEKQVPINPNVTTTTLVSVMIILINFNMIIMITLKVAASKARHKAEPSPLSQLNIGQNMRRWDLLNF